MQTTLKWAAEIHFDPLITEGLQKYTVLSAHILLNTHNTTLQKVFKNKHIWRFS